MKLVERTILHKCGHSGWFTAVDEKQADQYEQLLREYDCVKCRRGEQMVSMPE